jgi:DNA mismatch repair protein MutS2
VALLPQEERDVSRLLDELAEERRKLAAAREEAERAQRSAQGLERERKEGLERLLEERGALRAKAARQAREILRRAEESVRRTEAQIRQKGRLTETERRELAREHAREQAELARLEAPRKPAAAHGSVPDRVREGERYWAEALGREVEIARAPDAAGRVLVVQGGLKVELPLETLRIVGERAAAEGSKPVRSGGVTVPEVERPPVEVDLRGMRADEAIEKLDRALDQALLAGLKEVRVIHGKGTGALRDAVKEFCRAHSGVASARMADQWDGGTGATLVQLEG